MLYFIGSNGGTSEWLNPGAHGLVSVWSSDGRQLPYGRAEDALSRAPEPLNVHTNDDRRAFIAVDLGLHIVPTAYTLRHARGYGRSALRNWLFQVSTLAAIRILTKIWQLSAMSVSGVMDVHNLQSLSLQVDFSYLKG